jgi:hypothetical protein
MSSRRREEVEFSDHRTRRNSCHLNWLSMHAWIHERPSLRLGSTGYGMHAFIYPFDLLN